MHLCLSGRRHLLMHLACLVLTRCRCRRGRRCVCAWPPPRRRMCGACGASCCPGCSTTPHWGPRTSMCAAACHAACAAAQGMNQFADQDPGLPGNSELSGQLFHHERASPSPPPPSCSNRSCCTTGRMPRLWPCCPASATSPSSTSTPPTPPPPTAPSLSCGAPPPPPPPTGSGRASQATLS